MTIFTIDIHPLTNQETISDATFEQLCNQNPELKFETDAQGKLIVMSPTGSESGQKNGDLFFQIELWNRQYKLGVTFDSSTGFKLSNGATRSPDVSWIANNRWNALTKTQKRGFAPIDPDFVIELLSPSDDLSLIQQKMQEYRDCGVKLGWLIAPDAKRVEIYRLDREVEVLTGQKILVEEKILPKLTVDLAKIWV